MHGTSQAGGLRGVEVGAVQEATAPRGVRTLRRRTLGTASGVSGAAKWLEARGVQTAQAMLSAEVGPSIHPPVRLSLVWSWYITSDKLICSLTTQAKSRSV
jgi:hypothetical protein